MWRGLPPGELIPARNLLDPGLFCQAVLNAVLVHRYPELRKEKSHFGQDQGIYYRGEWLLYKGAADLALARLELNILSLNDFTLGWR